LRVFKYSLVERHFLSQKIKYVHLHLAIYALLDYFSKMVKIRVKDIEGVEHLFDLQKDEQKSIVDIAEEQGIELPYSCRSGACFSCCAEIKKGKQRLDREKTGEQLIDVEEEEFLCCIGGVDSAAFTAEEEVEITLEMQN